MVPYTGHLVQGFSRNANLLVDVLQVKQKSQAVIIFQQNLSYILSDRFGKGVIIMKKSCWPTATGAVSGLLKI